MAVKSCKVIWCDTEGVEDAVSLSAESLYDAVAQGSKFFWDQRMGESYRSQHRYRCEDQGSRD
jgi:hypothetical protein